MSISIIEFSASNFRLFKQKVTFSMLARKSGHTFESNGKHLLKTSLIYGPNASGKSTLLNVFIQLRNGVINSANSTEGSNIRYQPFELSSTENEPTFFEVVFSLDKQIFRYSFSHVKETIVEENLVQILSTGSEKKYLVRNGQNIKLYADFKKSKDVADVKTRPGVLFLSAASQWNDALAIKIVEGFKNINVISGPDSGNYRGYTMNMFKEGEDKKNKILDFLKKADFCIEDGKVEKMEIPENVKKQVSAAIKDLPDKIDTVYFSHNKFNAEGVIVGTKRFNLGDESAGTQKFFDALGPIVDTLENGKVLFIDEFDNSIHPYLTKFVVNLFEKSNPHNAQLVVTTHDTSLLSYKELNKEQFWFTEKDRFGAANLFSLSEFKLRNNTELSKKYLEGRFGALPFIDQDY